MIGSQIGRYQITGKLGEGGMGTVYRAEDPNAFGREVALKVLPRQFLNDPEFRRRFQREARIIVALEHPAIVPVYDVGEHNGEPFLVMRRMSGGSLKDRLRQGRLALTEIARILVVLAPALDDAHAQRIIHRDLKPDNILFDHRNSPYIADFGIAQLNDASTKFTATGAFIGTAAYMSPEQAQDASKVDRRSDIYSLGAMLFEMLTGEHPYHRVHPIALPNAHINQPVPRLDELRSDLPAGWQAIIDCAMAKKPNARYPTATALSNAVQRLATAKQVPPPRKPAAPAAVALTEPTLPPAQKKVSAPTVAPPPAKPKAKPKPTPKQPSTSSRKQSSQMWLWVGLALVGILLVFFGWFFFGRSSYEIVTQVSEKDGMTQVFVPEGEFLMGSLDNDRDANDDEKSQRTVYLDAFWIDQAEVTNGMYEQCVQDGACEAPSLTRSETRESYYGNPEYATYPVIYVSWNDASAYCAWAGRRLPTEAEWEKAARGTDGRIYPWGNEVPTADRLNFNRQVGDTTKVGSYPDGASPYGALDMAGNVWEWVADWYDKNYYKDAPQQNPTGPDSGTFKGLRGGSWNIIGARWLRAGYRGWFDPANRNDSYGVRCARSP